MSTKSAEHHREQMSLRQTSRTVQPNGLSTWT